MLHDRRGSMGFHGSFVHINGVAHADDHNTVETKPGRRPAGKFEALFGLTALLALSFGCSAGAQAWEGNWDGTAALRETENRDQRLFYSGPAIPSMTGFFHLKNRKFDWNTYQDLRTKGQMPRYMMRPPMGTSDQKETP